MFNSPALTIDLVFKRPLLRTLLIYVVKVAEQGFDSAFVRCFNYYFAYCEAGFASRTEGCQMLTFARPGTAALDSNAVTSVLAR